MSIVGEYINYPYPISLGVKKMIKEKSLWRNVFEDIKVRQKLRQEASYKRFLQVAEGKAVVITEGSPCKVVYAKRDKPRVKPAVLEPDKRELKQVNYTKIVYTVGNRRVGRRVKTTRWHKDYQDVLEHQFNIHKQFIVHPRRYDVVQPTSILERKRPSFATDTITVFNTEDNLELKVKYPNKVALVTPAQSYHRRINQRLQRGYRFIIKDGEIIAQKYDKFNQEWKPIEPEKVKYRKTHQYKTVWFTKHSRRK